MHGLALMQTISCSTTIKYINKVLYYNILITNFRVSPFSGGSHICPIDGPNEPTWTKWGGEVVNVTKMNAKR